MEYEHFILTKFNIVSPTWTKDKKNKIILDNNWLDHRFDLFKAFCLKSMLNQSNKNFKWLIYFCENTDKKYIKEIENINNNKINIIPKFVIDMHDLYSNLVSHIAENINKKTHYLITTRLDNDDLLGKEAIQGIQNRFNYQRYEFFNMNKGLMYDINNRLLFEKYQLSNPFISLFEKYSENITTVWCGEHGKLFEQGKIINDSSDYQWMQIVHSRNLSNLSSNKLLKPIIKIDLIKYFGLTKKNIQISLISFIKRKILYIFYKGIKLLKYD